MFSSVFCIINFAVPQISRIINSVTFDLDFKKVKNHLGAIEQPLSYYLRFVHTREKYLNK